MTPSPVRRRVREQLGHAAGPRLSALAALAADLAAFVIIAVLVFTKPLFAISLAVLTLAFVTSSFVMLTSSGRARFLAGLSLGLVGTAMVVGVVFWGYAADQRLWTAPLALLLLAIGSALGRYALRAAPTPATGPAPANAAAPATSNEGRSRFGHAVLIANPRSGGGKVEQFGLIEAAEQLGIETVVLEPGMDLRGVADDAIRRGADALGMAGGDGSMALVLDVAAQHDVPFVCVPAGTRNHFALDLGLERADPRPALQAFVDGDERRIDYAVANDRPFVNNVALGIYAALVEQDTYREAKLQTTLDLLPELAARGGPWFDLRFEVPDHGRLEQSALLIVSNNPYDIATDIQQRRAVDGGELGVLTINPERLGDLLGITLLAAVGKPFDARALWAWTTPTFTVDSGQAEVRVGIDGEATVLETPIVFRTVPRGARVLVPRGSRLGLDEQRRGPTRFSGLLEVAFNLPRP